MAIGIFKRVDMVLGVRLHAVLLASSMATPVVAIAYEQKVHGLMQRLDLQDYVVDLFSLNSEDLIDTMNRAMDKKEEIHQQLVKTVDQLRNLVIESARQNLSVPDSNVNRR